MKFVPAKLSDLPAVLALQRGNLRTSLDASTAASEGFLTVSHSLHQLEALSKPVPHTLAKGDGGQLLGYALSMSPVHRSLLPTLSPMFDAIEASFYEGTSIGDLRYTTMGQVCVAKEARGTGLFRAMYDAWFHSQRGHYELGCTEVAANNYRSLGAHLAVGFREIGRYDQGATTWVLVARAL